MQFDNLMHRGPSLKSNAGARKQRGGAVKHARGSNQRTAIAANPLVLSTAKRSLEAHSVHAAASVRPRRRLARVAARVGARFEGRFAATSARGLRLAQKPL